MLRVEEGVAGELWKEPRNAPDLGLSPDITSRVELDRGFLTGNGQERESCVASTSVRNSAFMLGYRGNKTDFDLIICRNSLWPGRGQVSTFYHKLAVI